MKAPDLPCNNNSRKIKRGAVLWDGGRLVLIEDVYANGTVRDCGANVSES